MHRDSGLLNKAIRHHGREEWGTSREQQHQMESREHARLATKTHLTGWSTRLSSEARDVRSPIAPSRLSSR